jgi:ADP-ribosylglycohydrolase
MIGAIAGGIAQAHYKTIEEHIIKKARALMDARLLKVVDAFNARYQL